MESSPGNTALRRGLLLAIPLLIGLFVLCYIALPYNTPRFGSLASGLRGDRVIIIQFPQRDGYAEQIHVHNDKVATHAFYPLQDPLAYSERVVPPSLWETLDQLRQAWCIQPPTFPQITPSALVYEVALQCGRAANPVVRIPPDQLPQPFVSLIASMPAPPQVRDGNLTEEP